MLNGHESVTIAQIIFYFPVIPVTLYLGGSRAAFLLLQGSRIATVVLLNVGLIPLIISASGITVIVYRPNLTPSLRAIEISHLDRMMLIIRLFYVAASGLLISGAAISLDGQRTGDYLVQAAYITFAVIISIIITMVLYLQSQKSRLAPASLIYLRGAAIAIPFLILRIVYALLSAFLNDNTWTPLNSSPVAFALMALLPEYATIVIYISLGFHRIREYAAVSAEAAANGGVSLSCMPK